MPALLAPRSKRARRTARWSERASRGCLLAAILVVLILAAACDFGSRTAHLLGRDRLVGSWIPAGLDEEVVAAVLAGLAAAAVGLLVLVAICCSLGRRAKDAEGKAPQAKRLELNLSVGLGGEYDQLAVPGAAVLEVLGQDVVAYLSAFDLRPARPVQRDLCNLIQATKSAVGANSSTSSTTISTSSSSTPHSSPRGIRSSAPAPVSIFHGLHLNFEELRSQLPHLAAEGYDAIQLPPAQTSRSGDLRREWYFRYQPLRYSKIDSLLGGEHALMKLCEEAAELGIMVIADCVFNHTAVVASRAEWEAAQKNPSLLEQLQQRLDRTFGPELCRSDFQWPWVCLEGAKWDDPRYTYEGWGCGEWSELSWSPKVLEVHFTHLRALLRCGVRGFRLDAAKHMRPGHVQRYVEFLHERGAFVYAEVLSLDRDVHLQYEELGNSVAPVLSTDFILASELRKALRHPDPASSLPRLAPLAHRPAESVRFARNHDTVLNDGAVGIEWRSAEDARVAWAYLLALPGGCALVYSDDREVPTVRRAVAFRRVLATSEDRASLKAEVIAWPPPSFSLVWIIVTGCKGELQGLAALNVSRSSAVPFCAPPSLEGLPMAEVLGGELHQGSWRPLLRSAPLPRGDGVVAANDARFFVPSKELAYSLTAQSLAGACAVQALTLLYFSGWQRPHLHFGMGNHWTSLPGWPLQASSPPHGATGKNEKVARNGRWWRVDVPLPVSSQAVEFVLHDGSGGSGPSSWDKTSRGENYQVPGAGAFVLHSGNLQRLGGST